MSKEPYRYIIGLEIHIELDTESKMFSVAKNDPFDSEANANVTPVCIGMPGTLPVPNKKAIEKTILLGLALNSTIAKESKFDRKHYFYPDLPKGYQISQYDQPLCEGGELSVDGQTVHFTRIHLEEDAGKLLHTKDAGSEVDLNRAGVPLMEIVTEPDITTPKQASDFLKELRAIARALDISSADMEKGKLRCDANVNIAFDNEGKEVKTYISEIKNLNSFRMVERAIIFEAKRLYDEWQNEPEKREQKNKITVGWDNVNGVTKIQRSKEGAADYRYFPEPDIPPLRIYGASADDPAPKGAIFDVAQIREGLVALPSQRKDQYTELGISEKDAATINKNAWMVAIINDLIKNELAQDKAGFKMIVSLLINDAKDGNDANQIIDVAKMRLAGEISSDTATKALAVLVNNNKVSATEYIKEQGWLMQSDGATLKPVIIEVLAAHKSVVNDYKNGKLQAIGFLVGQVMQKIGGSANPQQVKLLLEEELKS